MAGILDRHRREPSGLWLPRMCGLAGTAYGWCESCCVAWDGCPGDAAWLSQFASTIQLTASGFTGSIGSDDCTLGNGTFVLTGANVFPYEWEYSDSYVTVYAHLTCSATPHKMRWACRISLEYPSHAIAADFVSGDLDGPIDCTNFAETCYLNYWGTCTTNPSSVVVESSP
jgi:hypothetical protein